MNCRLSHDQMSTSGRSLQVIRRRRLAMACYRAKGPIAPPNIESVGILDLPQYLTTALES
jgi:hypothetical protein